MIVENKFNPISCGPYAHFGTKLKVLIAYFEEKSDSLFLFDIFLFLKTRATLCCLLTIKIYFSLDKEIRYLLKYSRVPANQIIVKRNQLEINCLDSCFLIESFFLSCKWSHINFNHNFVTLVSSFSIVFILDMSLCQWNMSFECKQLAKITTSLVLYQANLGVSQPEEEMMLQSLLSSSAAPSSSSLSSSSLASGMDLDNAMDVDPVLLKLIVTTTTLKDYLYNFG